MTTFPNAFERLARRAISRETLVEYAAKAGKDITAVLTAYDDAQEKWRNPVILWQPETGAVDVLCMGIEPMGD